MVVPILICIQPLSISVKVESNGSASLPKESREVFARRPFTTLTCSASSLSDDALPEQHSRIFFCAHYRDLTARSKICSMLQRCRPIGTK